MAEAQPTPDAEPTVIGEAEVPAEPPEPALAPRRSGFIGPVAGGAIAAALGFGLSMYVLPQGWQPAADMTGLVAEQEARITKLESDLAALKTAKPVDDTRIPALETGLAELRAGLADNIPRLDDLETRLAAVEAMPMGAGGISPAALTALQADLAALKSQVATGTGGNSAVLAEVEAAAKAAEDRLAKAEAEAAALQADAEKMARAARVTATLGRVQAALEAGTPFAKIAVELEAAGVTLPSELKDAAEKGVPALSALRDAYPEAARAALEASLRANPGEGWTGRLGSFLQSQTGARSLTPREGTDPDAVLSRAEAALATGDLARVLTELDGLPPEGQAAMAAWVAGVQARIGAEAALASLMEANP
jgi:hypothetical protein